MGICPSLSPDEQVIEKKNDQIKKIILFELKELSHYKFYQPLKEATKKIANRYLVTEGILEDIDKLLFMSRKESSITNQSSAFENFDEEVKNSCLILEDEAIADQNKYNQNDNIQDSITESFKNNIQKYQSLVVQMNIVYKNDFDNEKYKNSLKFFLKWASIFQQHSYGGFLKPIYRQFCQSLYKTSVEDIQSILDETRKFVYFMVSIYTNVYRLKELNASMNGDLFKIENIFNLIMSYIFKRTKIKKFVKILILHKEASQIKKFEKKLEQICEKPPEFFGIPSKFCLHSPKKPYLNQSEIDLCEKQDVPYKTCIKMIDELGDDSQTPITKLKIIVAISKQIMTEITNFYSQSKKEIPEIDPDSIISIIIFIIARANRSYLYEELKLVECFTTTNCLNSISGFYLNTFNAAIQSILII